MTRVDADRARVGLRVALQARAEPSHERSALTTAQHSNTHHARKMHGTESPRHVCSIVPPVCLPKGEPPATVAGSAPGYGAGQPADAAQHEPCHRPQRDGAGLTSPSLLRVSAAAHQCLAPNTQRRLFEDIHKRYAGVNGAWPRLSCPLLGVWHRSASCLGREPPPPPPPPPPPSPRCRHGSGGSPHRPLANHLRRCATPASPHQKPLSRPAADARLTAPALAFPPRRTRCRGPPCSPSSPSLLPRRIAWARGA